MAATVAGVRASRAATGRPAAGQPKAAGQEERSTHTHTHTHTARGSCQVPIDTRRPTTAPPTTTTTATTNAALRLVVIGKQHLKIGGDRQGSAMIDSAW